MPLSLGEEAVCTVSILSAEDISWLEVTTTVPPVYTQVGVVVGDRLRDRTEV
jgi:hypothetical protein